jgi:hypothetical protein
MLNKLILLIGCFAVSSMAVAECVNINGKVTCGNGQEAARYNPYTGNAAKTETGAMGIKHTETRYGGEAYTKNGKGVVQTPGGTTCVKTAHNRSCR